MRIQRILGTSLALAAALCGNGVSAAVTNVAPVHRVPDISLMLGMRWPSYSQATASYNALLNLATSLGDVVTVGGTTGFTQVTWMKWWFANCNPAVNKCTAPGFTPLPDAANCLRCNSPATPNQVDLITWVGLFEEYDSLLVDGILTFDEFSFGLLPAPEPLYVAELYMWAYANSTKIIDPTKAAQNPSCNNVVEPIFYYFDSLPPVHPSGVQNDGFLTYDELYTFYKNAAATFNASLYSTRSNFATLSAYTAIIRNTDLRQEEFNDTVRGADIFPFDGKIDSSEWLNMAFRSDTKCPVVVVSVYTGTIFRRLLNLTAPVSAANALLTFNQYNLNTPARNNAGVAERGPNTFNGATCIDEIEVLQILKDQYLTTAGLATERLAFLKKGLCATCPVPAPLLVDAVGILGLGPVLPNAGADVLTRKVAATDVPSGLVCVNLAGWTTILNS